MVQGILVTSQQQVYSATHSTLCILWTEAILSWASLLHTALLLHTPTCCIHHALYHMVYYCVSVITTLCTTSPTRWDLFCTRCLSDYLLTIVMPSTSTSTPTLNPTGVLTVMPTVILIFVPSSSVPTVSPSGQSDSTLPYLSSYLLSHLYV